MFSIIADKLVVEKQGLRVVGGALDGRVVKRIGQKKGRGTLVQFFDGEDFKEFFILERCDKFNLC